MRRITETYKQTLQKNIKNRNKKISELENFVAMFDAGFWEQVVRRLNVRLNHSVNDRETNFMKMSEVELKVAIARELELKETIRLPQVMKYFLDKKVAENASDRQKVKQIRGGV